MGTYYTCEICGIEGKGCYWCKCNDKIYQKLQKMKIGYTIVEIFSYVEIISYTYAMKLIRATGNKHTDKQIIYISGNPAELGFSISIPEYEIDEECYNELKKQTIARMAEDKVQKMSEEKTVTNAEYDYDDYDDYDDYFIEELEK